MITPEQRRKLESEWSSDEQSIVRICLLARAAVMLLLIVGLAWIGLSDRSLNDAQEASAAMPAFSSRQAPEATAVQASRDAGRDVRHMEVSR